MYLMQVWHTSAYGKVIKAMFEIWQQKFFCSIPRNPQLAANINNYGSARQVGTVIAKRSVQDVNSLMNAISQQFSLSSLISANYTKF